MNMPNETHRSANYDSVMSSSHVVLRMFMEWWPTALLFLCFVLLYFVAMCILASIPLPL